MDGFGIGAVAIGSLFIYGGIKGFSPLTALTNVISGKNPNENQAFTQLTAQQQNAATIDQTLPGSNTGGTPSQNQALAKILAAPYGWSTGQEWNDLVSLWQKESGWDQTATNASSGAYGIPQALPASKMASAGADWKTNPATQIKWGLGYIRDTYGSPSNAWAHELANNWY